MEKIILKGKSGMTAELWTLGATLNSLCVPDKNGKLRDVVLGFENEEQRRSLSSYQGESVGRYANRISGGSFVIDGERFEVSKNENGSTCLHGGGEFSHVEWESVEVTESSAVFAYTSPDGSCGFPGEVGAVVSYSIVGSALEIEYFAVSDKKTVINMTNHSYFNLNGFDAGDVLSHELLINADSFIPTDENSIPTGEVCAVRGTPFDFTRAKPIGRDIGDPLKQLAQCRGFDHNFCLREREQKTPAAVAFAPESGIEMKVFTDMPGVQLYCGNFLKGEIGKAGAPMVKHAGFCLETQFYPDSPNRPEFPSAVFDAGQPFSSTTVFDFSVRD